jgi:enoyl-CoA hydratase/carnithine racemase
MGTITFEQEGAVAWLRLNRPEKLNAMTPEMWAEMRELGQRLLEDPHDVRCLVVIGNGRAFSAGIDTSTFGGGAPLDPGPISERTHQDELVAGILRAQEAYTWLEDVPFPTIAAVRGYALGAGIQLAAACDLRACCAASANSA